MSELMGLSNVYLLCDFVADSLVMKKVKGALTSNDMFGSYF
jgi:hypothetical protein